MKKQTKTILALILCLSLFMTSIFAATTEELKKQMEAAGEAKKAAQHQVDLTQNTIEGIRNELQKANDAIAEINTKIAELDKKIEDLNEKIEATKLELQAAEEKKLKQEEALKERVRVMYMYGEGGYIQLLFSATDFGDFFSKAEKIGAIMKADKESVSELEKTRKQIENQKISIEEDRQSIENSKSQQVSAKTEQETIKSQQDELLAKNKEVLESYREEVKRQEAAEAAASAEIDRIIAEEMERQRKANEEAAAKGEPIPHPEAPAPSSGFHWPVPASHDITSYFGYRGDDPTLPAGASTYHGGIDIGAPTGSTVVASAAGTVISADWNGGYGKCIVIDCGGGMFMFYGHLNSMNVSAGETVSAGEAIAGVGTTGVSSGPHLHFEIRINGERVDPLNYL